MNDWRKYKLGELLKFSNGRTSPNRSEKLPFPVFGSNGLIGFSNKHNTEGDAIIIGRVGSYCGSLYYAKNPCWITDNAIKAIARNNNNPKYLFFLLKSINLNYYKGGSGQPLLNQATLNAIEAWSTSNINEQCRIAEILGVLDDKIEINLEMNKTLEEMAMAIYKEWFVDFGPFRDGEFVDSELGPIPKGWEVQKFFDIADLLSGGTPKTSVSEFWNGDIKWVSAKDIGNSSQVMIMATEKKITPLGMSNSSTKLLPKYTVIVVARGSVGKFGMIIDDMCMNQSCYGIYGKSSYGQPFIYLMISFFMDFLKRVSYGSVFDTITTATFKTMNLALPSKDLMHQFNKHINSLFKLIESNTVENHFLKQTRDYLLPKLISGEIRVKAAEEKMKEVL